MCLNQQMQCQYLNKRNEYTYDKILSAITFGSTIYKEFAKYNFSNEICISKYFQSDIYCSIILR